MKLLVDNQLPSALARFLTVNGVESQHVLEVGLDVLFRKAKCSRIRRL